MPITIVPPVAVSPKSIWDYLGTPKIAASYANSTSYVTLVNVSGEGLLTGIACVTDQRGYFRITIDGTTLADSFFSWRDDYRGCNGMGMLLRFKSSLHVEIRDSYRTTNAAFWCAYTLTGSEKVGEKYVVVRYPEAEGRDYVYLVEKYLTRDGRVFTVKTLKGCARLAEVRVSKQVYGRGEDIVGEVVFRNWKGEALSLDEVPAEFELKYAPAGRMLARKIRLSRNTLKFRIPVDKVPEGEYRIWTDLLGFANIPATCMVEGGW